MKILLKHVSPFSFGSVFHGWCLMRMFVPMSVSMHVSMTVSMFRPMIGSVLVAMFVFVILKSGWQSVGVISYPEDSVNQSFNLKKIV
jgi:hypothetical protein